MPHATCYKRIAPNGPPLFQHGNLVFQAHYVGWIVSGFFTIIAIVASFWLVNKHLQWYTNKRQQRYIVRLLFMVPLYASISFASYLFWNHSIPLLLIRDCYESIVLTSFFYLLLTYLSPIPDEQKAILLKVGLSRQADREARKQGKEPQKWIFPLGFIKSKPEDGLYFLQMMKWGVLQYCVIRPLTTLVAVILNLKGLYCDGSWGLEWGFVYIIIIVSVSVSIAMYCLIQLYVSIAAYIAPEKPLLKLFAVKAVVFLTFWQATGLSLLQVFGVVKDTTYMTADDISVGICAILETFEMMLFAFLHIHAFTYKPYRTVQTSKSKSPSPIRTPRLRSLGHAMDFRETFREIWHGCAYIYDKWRGKEPTPDVGARRAAYYEGAFGRTRPSHLTEGKTLHAEHLEKEPKRRHKDPSLPAVRLETEEGMDMDNREERQWLGLGDNSGYRLGKRSREKSDGLEEQIERELQRRGYGSQSDIPGRGHIGARSGLEAEGPNLQHSWWRSIYNSVSQSSHDAEDRHLSPGPSKRRGRTKSKSRSRQHSRDGNDENRLLSGYNHDFDDPPPQGVLRTYRSRHRPERHSLELRPEAPAQGDLGSDGGADVLAPLSTFNMHRNSHLQRQRQHRTSTLDTTTNTTSNQNLLSNLTYHPENIVSNPYTDSPLLAPPLPFHRSDSLLDRIFPHNIDNESSEHENDTSRSLFSMSAHEVSPSGATPRARLTKSTPAIEEFGMAGERHTSQSQVEFTPPGFGWTHHILHTSPTEVIEKSRSPSPPPVPDKDIDPTGEQRSHRRESALHGIVLDAAFHHTSSSLNLPSQSAASTSLRFLADDGDTNPASLILAGSTSPLSQPEANIPYDQDVAPTFASERSRLRRGPVQTTSPRGKSSRSHQQHSLAALESGINSPQLPEHTYIRQPTNRASAHRRTSAILDSISQQVVPSPTSSGNHRPNQSRHSVHNSSPAITQSPKNDLSSQPDLVNRIHNGSSHQNVLATCGQSSRTSYSQRSPAHSVYPNQLKPKSPRAEARKPRRSFADLNES